MAGSKKEINYETFVADRDFRYYADAGRKVRKIPRMESDLRAFLKLLQENKIRRIFAAELRYGVMVALQILVLSVQVRILVSQLQSPVSMNYMDSGDFSYKTWRTFSSSGSSRCL